MSDYTPMTGVVRRVYSTSRVTPAVTPALEEAFDRWLAEHDREVAAKACDRLTAAIHEALDFRAVLPAIATRPREILTKALEGTS